VFKKSARFQSFACCVLQQVPAGEWFCPDCRPKEVKSPRKGRRRAFSQEDSSEEEEEEDRYTTFTGWNA